MTASRNIRLGAFSLMLTFSLSTILAGQNAVPLDQLSLPDGFRIEILAEGVDNARSLALGSQGTIFVATRTLGRVYALRDSDGDGRADRSWTLASGLYMPNGVAFRGGDLYVAEVNRVLRYRDIEQHLGDPPTPEVFVDGLPRDRHHGWKFIRFGPDGRLYIGIGAPCNICKPEDDRYAGISRVDANGGRFEVFARGVRNTIGFDWHPETGVLWFTDNGRDMMGDDLPPDELNRAPEAGMHFGYPFCHGRNIADPEFGEQRGCAEFTPPALPLSPHTAALGMRFYRGNQFPAPYKNRIFIAEHGSWNRSRPIGYRIVTVEVKDGHAEDFEVFAEGWLQEGRAWGRPADLLSLPDGSLLVSDDLAGVLYRISYQPSGRATTRSSQP